MSDLSDLSPEFIAAVDAMRRLAAAEKWSTERWNRMVDLLVDEPPSSSHREPTSPEK